MSNSLDPDQARHFVGSDLDPTCLQRLSADGKSPLAREELKLLTFNKKKIPQKNSFRNTECQIVWIQMRTNKISVEDTSFQVILYVPVNNFQSCWDGSF